MPCSRPRSRASPRTDRASPGRRRSPPREFAPESAARQGSRRAQEWTAAPWVKASDGCVGSLRPRRTFPPRVARARRRARRPRTPPGTSRELPGTSRELPVFHASCPVHTVQRPHNCCKRATRARCPRSPRGTSRPTPGTSGTPPGTPPGIPRELPSSHSAAAAQLLQTGNSGSPPGARRRAHAVGQPAGEAASATARQ
jgi:hypothetical protein